MRTPVRVLIAGDFQHEAEVMLSRLREGGYDPVYERVDTAEGMSVALAGREWDLVICDHSMLRFSATGALALLRNAELDLPIIVVSGKIREKKVALSMKAGARDYVMKDNPERLLPAIERVVREAALRKLQREAEKRTEEQLRVAREIQQGLFPQSHPKLPGFDIAGASFPAAATGGDFFDYIPMQEDCLGIVVADVSGHGLGPALLMAETHTGLRALALTSSDVSKILSGANRLLNEDFGEKRFVTVVFAKLCPQTRSLTYASAGHPHCYVLSPSGRVDHVIENTGIALGLSSESEFPSAPPIALRPGQVVIFLTDGVMEAGPSRNKPFGIDRALGVVRAHMNGTAEQIVGAVCTAALDFSKPGRQVDDITAVVLKVLPTA